jgi:hypothetical protein
LEIEVVLSQGSASFRTSLRPAEVHKLTKATLKKSWRNILTAQEKLIADDLYEKVLDMKNAGGKTMIDTEVVVVFLNHHIQPVMSRAHQMWL